MMPAARRILLVEDDYFVSHDLTMTLEAAGVEVVGPAPTVAAARRLVEASPRLDGAIVDINLGGAPSFALVDLLTTQGVPVVFASGYDRTAIPARYALVPLCEKPVNVRHCLAMLRV